MYSDAFDVDEAAELIREISPPAEGGIGARINSAARRLGWSYSRTKGVWYREAQQIAAHEMRRLKDVARRKKVQEAQSEFAELRDRLSRIETALSEVDHNHARPFVAALRASAGGSGLVDGAGD